MSAEPSPGITPVVDQLSADPTGGFKKSYRRKYRKIMVRFEEKMKESNGLFKDEQRIFDISQRLAEQTDQILQLLLELNSCPQIPKRLRYNLQPQGSDVTITERQDEQQVHEYLRSSRQRVQKGELAPFDYQESGKALVHSVEFAPARSYAALLKETKVPTPTKEDASDTTSSSMGAYLTIRQEEQYLQSLDLYLDGKSEHPRTHASGGLDTRNGEKPTDRERETQLRNPVSVCNWLRKHQPQVFLQDPEANNEKAKQGSRSSKRTTALKEAKQEQEPHDDDGVANDRGSGSRGKRKRDDDGGYRPKGGHAKPSKRKKEEGALSGKRSKRASVDARMT